MTRWPAPRSGWVAVLVAAVCFLPFARGLLAGGSLYFRDLSRHFFPLRLFALEGLRLGELRYWNPWVHEGIPTPFAPISYPLDLLQLLRPDEVGLSLVLALHVPLAALAFMALARGLGCRPHGAAGGALAYALGGFCLSSLNLYVYVQAIAWAPLVVLALQRAAREGGRLVAAAALATAVAVSTAGVEIVAQAVMVGISFAYPSGNERPMRVGRAALRIVAALALAATLAAPTIVAMAGVVQVSERGGGFPTSVVLAHSVYPLTWLQVLVADLYGDLHRITDAWWGSNYFPRGFPYFLSLYLGPPVVALAAAGATLAHPRRRREIVLLALAVWICLGRWGGWEIVVDALPPLHAFRFPTKVFFTVHLLVALLAARGLDGLADGGASRRVATLALSVGALLVSTLALPAVAPGASAWFVEGFFPPGMPAEQRAGAWAHMLGDAAQGGALALCVGALAALAWRKRLDTGVASWLAVGILAADLLRAGAGLNPMVSSAFWRLSPEVAALVPHLRDGQRSYVCEPQQAAAYWQGRRLRRGNHELWTFGVYLDTLTPNSNMRHGVPFALSEDMTGLVPRAMAPPEEAGCGRLDDLLPRLREAGVAHVLSLDPLPHAELVRVATLSPDRMAPISLHAYDLPGAVRLVEVAGVPDAEIDVVADEPGRVELDVRCPADCLLVVRQGWAPGWSAEVDGRAVPAQRVEGRYLGVAVNRGGHVRLRYRPPGIAMAVLLSALTSIVIVVLGCGLRRVPLTRPRAAPRVPDGRPD